MAKQSTMLHLFKSSIAKITLCKIIDLQVWANCYTMCASANASQWQTNKTQ
ncbi:hypothetical protein [Helicobacter rodentium]|uniref:hypothetical protein n=1 Tax=Helicobacter rodentium TaxID=59617 RepID=UPI0023F3AB29|nr:hypothetical protein [Helicobacter rodentium]